MARRYSTQRRPVGRPKLSLPDIQSPISGRVRLLIDTAHEGNILEASGHSLVPYATLRTAYFGMGGTPGLRTLQRLVRTYQIPLAWFVEGEGQLPRSGWVRVLPPEPDVGAGWRYIPTTTIPFRAWRLGRLFDLLERYLGSLPPGPERPILGGATEEQEINRRLSSFLLGPLLAARAAGETEAVILDDPPRPRWAPKPAYDVEAWVGRLRALGAWWETTIPSLVTAARETVT